MPIECIVHICGVTSRHWKVAVYQIVSFDSPIDQIVNNATVDNIGRYRLILGQRARYYRDVFIIHLSHGLVLLILTAIVKLVCSLHLLEASIAQDFVVGLLSREGHSYTPCWVNRRLDYDAARLFLLMPIFDSFVPFASHIDPIATHALHHRRLKELIVAFGNQHRLKLGEVDVRSMLLLHD